MANVNLKRNENFDKLIRRFKRACENDKIIIEARNREFFESKSEKNRKQKKSCNQAPTKRK